MIGIVLLRSISFGIYVLSLGSFLAGFASSYWYKRHDIYNVAVWHGLWKLCDEHWEFENGQLCYNLIPNKTYPDNTRLRAVQAMMVMSLICAVGTLPSYIVWMSRSERWLGQKKAAKLGMVTLSLCLATGGFNALGVVIFGVNYSKYEEVLNWSFILAVASGGLYLLNGLICILLIQCCDVKPAKDATDSLPRTSDTVVKSKVTSRHEQQITSRDGAFRQTASPMIGMDSVYELEDEQLDEGNDRHSRSDRVLNIGREMNTQQNSIV